MPSCVFRIIPARAGFTGRDSVYAPDLPDHPRSRGVYRDSTEVMACRLGSSPLARGLLDPSAVREAQDGIIPARAGFTSRLRATSSTSRDHPRSRGVYVFTRLLALRTLGSSPLARGLLRARPKFATDRRIIPARAGFTPVTRRGGTSTTDHPRSRGVYLIFVVTVSKIGGSSPLARGLQGALGLSPPVGGIIPARAGFTTRATAGRTSPRDHPRSRGVYIRSQAERSRSRGSSPLARGLRCCVPACAGGAGSSPLARGLPGASVTVTGVRGIIPARAGFTSARPSPRSCRSDHPRSRGVYVRPYDRIVQVSGSSPLARGLH